MISVQYASTQVLQLKYYQLHKWFYFILLLIPAVKIALVLQSSHATAIQDSMLVSVVGPSFFPSITPTLWRAERNHSGYGRLRRGDTADLIRSSLGDRQ